MSNIPPVSLGGSPDPGNKKCDGLAGFLAWFIAIQKGTQVVAELASSLAKSLQAFSTAQNNALQKLTDKMMHDPDNHDKPKTGDDLAKAQTAYNTLKSQYGAVTEFYQGQMDSYQNYSSDDSKAGANDIQLMQNGPIAEQQNLSSCLRG